MKDDHRSYIRIRNFCSRQKKAWKKFRLVEDSNPWRLRYRCRGQGFESRTNLNFFKLSFRNCKSCVYNCDDHSSFNLIKQSVLITRAHTSWMALFSLNELNHFRVKLARNYKIVPFEFSKIIIDKKACLQALKSNVQLLHLL